MRIVLLVCAVILIIAGVFNGSARDVLGKAIKICTECVGLG
ncbi:MAG: thioredoxin [Oscillospiraceae bacterium]|nr:thioredoxin [Oscillospiraceae bacterium]